MSNGRRLTSQTYSMAIPVSVCGDPPWHHECCEKTPADAPATWHQIGGLEIWQLDNEPPGWYQCDSLRKRDGVWSFVLVCSPAGKSGVYENSGVGPGGAYTLKEGGTGMPDTLTLNPQ